MGIQLFLSQSPKNLAYLELVMDLVGEVEVVPRGSVKTAELSLGSTKVKVKTDATPQLMKQVKDLVDLRFQELSKVQKKGNLSDAQLHMLVAFNLAEDLIREKARVRLAKKTLTERIEGLVERIRSHLNHG